MKLVEKILPKTHLSFLKIFFWFIAGLSILFLPAMANENLNDLLIFEVHIDQYVLDVGLNAYREGKLLFLPLGELSSQLSIAVSSDVIQKQATGFILNENRQFLFDLASMTVSIAGKKSSVDPKYIRIQDNEIYIDSHLYSQWFPVDLSYDTSALVLDVTAREELPIQAKLKRDKRVRQQQTESGDLGFPNEETPYSLIDRPFIDQTIGGTLTATPHQPNKTTGDYTTLIVGDMLGMETNILLNGSDTKTLDQHRVTMGRDDPDARLLGPLKARSFSFGNVTTPTMNYIARGSTLGTGAYLSNRRLSKPSLFDKQSFDGTLLPGWDVELFHNGVLIDRQTATATAKYQFDDIPLLYGSNDFTLIFHGPLGQVRKEQHRFLLEDAMVLPGERYYTLGSVQFPHNGGSRTFAQFDQSVFSRLSATAGFLTSNETSQNIVQSRRSYFNLGLRSYWESLFLSTDMIRSDEGGTLGSIGIRTGFWNTSLSLTNAFLNNFSSEFFPVSDDPGRMQTKLRADTFLPGGLPLTVEGNRLQLKSGLQNYDVSGKISTSLLGVFSSNKITYQVFGNATSATVGELLISGHLGRWSLRGNFNYNVRPITQGNSLELSANMRLNQAYNLTSSLSSDLINDQIGGTVGLNKGVGDFGYGISVGATSKGEKVVGITINAGFGIEPRRSEIFTSARPMTPTGAASARVFLDKNMNDVMDADDTPVSGVGFRVNGGESSSRTDEQGVVLLTHLPTKNWVNVGLDRSSIDDPQLTPRKKGVRLLPRSGKLAEVEFPLMTTTEVDGTLSIFDGEKTKKAAGIEIELVDAVNKDQVISTTKTSYDGYYILTEVPAGRYVLRIASDHASKLKIISSNLKAINILPSSGFISGVDIVTRMPKFGADYNLAGLPRSIASVAEDQQETKFYYVMLGTFVNQESFRKVLSQLSELKVPYGSHEFYREINTYWIEAGNFDSKKQAKTLKDLLAEYGYPVIVADENNKFKTLIGPYYTEQDAIKDKGIVSASIPAVTIKLKRENTFLTELAMGAYSSKKDAEKVAARIKSYNFCDVSIQQRSVPQWQPEQL